MTSTYIHESYIYIYIYICVCVCINIFFLYDVCKSGSFSYRSVFIKAILSKILGAFKSSTQPFYCAVLLKCIMSIYLPFLISLQFSFSAYIFCRHFFSTSCLSYHLHDTMFPLFRHGICQIPLTYLDRMSISIYKCRMELLI